MPSKESTLEYAVVNLTCDRKQPKAGTPFKMTVELDRYVEGTDVSVALEKQRIITEGGGNPGLRGIAKGYFEIVPKPIIVKVGERSGTSESIEVKIDAIDEHERPIIFPEQLLLSAQGSEEVPRTPKYRSLVVVISPPG
jgi:hypothetical protein